MPIQSKIDGDRLELRIYDAIGPEWAGMVSAASVMKAIDDAGDVSDIIVKINSPGGSAFDGITVHNALKSNPANVTTIAEGLAASAASLIFMAGNTRQIHENAFLVVHQASGIAMGNADDMTAVARDLKALDESIAQTYATITGNDPEDVMATMKEDMLMNANDAMADGYATEIISGEVPQMMFNPELLNTLPDAVAQKFARRDQPENEVHDMTPDQFRAKHEDAVNDWINEGEVAGYANAKSDAKEMIDACGGDKEAAFDAWLAGKSIADARNERTQTVEQKLADAQAKLEEYEAKVKAAEAKAEAAASGADEVSLNPSATVDKDEKDEKFERVKKQAGKIKNDYARNRFIESSGYSPADFDFDE